ncbi:retention module-containing protein, partial [Achromobacter sp. F4_2707]|uniref:retention module-containing protein n=1 Tax=Achromobacter sp. F4_2707 TaxID=3114286 RepID=UPI0039C6F4DE
MASVSLITQVTGQAWVRGTDGSLTPLREGMSVPADAQIVTADGASVQLQPEGMPAVSIGENRQVQLGADMAQAPVDPSAAAAGALPDGDAARVLAALQAGEDPFEVLDATAAVTTGGGGDDGGSSFTRLAAIIETTTPLGLEYPRPSQPGIEDVRLGGGGVGGEGAAAPVDGLTAPSTLVISAASNVVEGNTITYTAVVSNPVAGSPLVVTLTNGAIITIPVGGTTGTVVVDTRPDDVYLQGDIPETVGVADTTGGNYESLDTSSTTTTVVMDDDDPVQITLEGPETVVEGEPITITARVEQPPQDTPLVITLTNGEQITIAVGETEGSVTFESRGDDDLVQGNDPREIGIQSSEGGNYENPTHGGSVTTTVLDNDVPKIIVSDVTINEGDTGTFEVTFDKPVDNATTVTLKIEHGNTDDNDVDSRVPPVVEIGGVPVAVTDNGDGTFSFELPPNTIDGVTVTVQSGDDETFEGEEDFKLIVTQEGETANGTELPGGIRGEGTGTIVDDGSGPGDTPDDDRPEIVVEGGGRVREGEPAEFVVKLVGEVKDPQEVELQLDVLTGGTNSADAADVGEPVVTYVDAGGNTETLTIVDGKVTLPAGVTEIRVSVPTVADDTHEGEETFQLKAIDNNGVTSNGEATGDASIFDKPSIEIPDTNDGPDVVPGNVSIAEDATDAVGGTFIVDAPAGLEKLVIAGQDVTLSALENLGTTPVTIGTDKGSLKLVSYNPDTGAIGYEYTVAGAQDHQAGDESVVDRFEIIAVDTLEQTSDGELGVLITDTDPVANDEDGGTVVEDAAVERLFGNVLANDTAIDGPVTLVAWGDNAAEVARAEQYGTLALRADGTWEFKLDNSLSAVQALTEADTLDFAFDYVITDSDGDEATATLRFSIQGAEDASKVDVIPGQDTGGQTGVVDEKGLGDDSDHSETTGGTITLSSTDGIATITINDETFTLSEWQGKSVDTGRGTLTITAVTPGSDSSTATLTYSYTLNGAQTHPDGAERNTLDEDPIAVTVTGVGGTTASGTIEITIVDDIPTVTVGEALEVVAGNSTDATAAGSFTFDFGADADGGAKSFTLNGAAFTAPTEGAPAVISTDRGTLTINVDGSYTYEAKPNVSGTEEFVFVITDADGDTATDTLTVTITKAQGPEGGVIQAVTVNESGLVDGDPKAGGEFALVTIPTGFEFAGVVTQGTYG